MQSDTLQIADRLIGGAHPALIIAEVALAHDGSLGAAYAYIDAAAGAGVDAVKFQTHIAEAESSPAEPFRSPVFIQDKTRFDYWKRTGFALDQWKGLADHARHRGLIFLSSPFSDEAVNWLLECQVPAWKVASGEVSNLPMIRKMAATGLPVLLSSGMSGWAELDAAVTTVKESGATFGVFQCTSAYPSEPEKWGLNGLGELAARYHCAVGFSDHSGVIVSGIAAVVLGARMLEFHVTFHRKQFGPDVAASLTFEEAGELVRSVRLYERAAASPLDRDVQAKSAEDLRQIFTKSVVTARALRAGAVVAVTDLTTRKPGNGIPAAQLDRIVGRKLRRDATAGEFLRGDDLDPPL